MLTRRKRAPAIGTIIACSLLLLTAGVVAADERAWDAPDAPPDSAVVFKAAGSYDAALRVWTSAEDIGAWIAANFSYDRTRAMRLSETRRSKEGPADIYAPAEVFALKTGVCVDLSRFGVEALRAIDPGSDPRYVMIEFEPTRIAGNVLRWHWVVSFRRDGKTYVFADSKRPGHVAGPYDDVAAFIPEYERYRGRPIVSFREVTSYQKQRRAPAVSREAAARETERER